MAKKWHRRQIACLVEVCVKLRRCSYWVTTCGIKSPTKQMHFSWNYCMHARLGRSLQKFCSFPTQAVFFFFFFLSKSALGWNRLRLLSIVIRADHRPGVKTSCTTLVTGPTSSVHLLHHLQITIASLKKKQTSDRVRLKMLTMCRKSGCCFLPSLPWHLHKAFCW